MKTLLACTLAMAITGCITDEVDSTTQALDGDTLGVSFDDVAVGRYKTANLRLEGLPVTRADELALVITFEDDVRGAGRGVTFDEVVSRFSSVTELHLIVDDRDAEQFLAIVKTERATGPQTHEAAVNRADQQLVMPVVILATKYEAANRTLKVINKVD